MIVVIVVVAVVAEQLTIYNFYSRTWMTTMTVMTSLYQIWRSNNNDWQYEATLSIYGHISFHWYCAHPIDILSLPLFLRAVCFLSFMFCFLAYNALCLLLSL